MIISLLYYLMGYLLLGAVGLYLAGRRGDRSTQRNRWLKYGTYSLIVYGVVLSIVWRCFAVVAGMIVLIGAMEVLWAATRNCNRLVGGRAIALYTLITSGFLTFAFQSRPSLLLFVYFQVLSFDAFAQVIGQLWGRHPLMPKISPNKTIEGLIGGTFFCLLSAVLAKDWVGMALLPALGLGLLTAGLALMGDALASYFKRLCQIKDYGTWLPGQGGILDRFDSLLMVGLGYAGLSILGWG